MSNLTLIYVQIKLFMEQINIYETTEMLACGVLNFKLSFLVSVSIIKINLNNSS